MLFFGPDRDREQYAHAQLGLAAVSRMLTPWEYLVLAGLGALHGVNPAMGWPMAVAAGIRDHSRIALLRTLIPLAGGHGLSVFAVALLVSVLRSVVTTQVVVIVGGVVLVAYGLWQAVTRRHLHPGFPLSRAHLTVWSFLMSSVHGAGLALLPFLVTTPVVATGHLHSGLPVDVRASLWVGATATLVHTLSMVVVTGTMALLAFQLTDLPMLRVRAWAHLDRVWAFALAGCGIFALGLALST